MSSRPVRSLVLLLSFVLWSSFAQMLPARASAAMPQVSTAAAQSWSGFTLLPTAQRILDTRAGSRPVAGATTAVDIRGRAIPGNPSLSSATAVIVNLTAVDAAGSGSVSAFPDGQSSVTTSNLNVYPSRTVANQAVVPVGSDGKIAVRASTGAHLIVDLIGYADATTAYHAVTPVRALDTRSGRQPSAGSVSTVALSGRYGIPAAGVAAAVVNVTAVNPARAGYLQVYPGSQRPTTSTVNYSAGRTTAGMTIVPMGTDGRISLYTSAASHQLVDVVGWIPARSTYRPLSSARIVDTRSGLGGQHGAVAAGGTLTISLGGAGGLPTQFNAVEVNVTAVGAQRNGWVGITPDRGAATTSTLNLIAGSTVSNSTTLSSADRVYVHTTAATDFVVDVVGYWATPSDPDVVSGGAHACALSPAGSVSCWGAGESGQLGTGSLGDQTRAVDVRAAGGASALAAGRAHTCAIANGSVLCWGANNHGQLGNGGHTNSSLPVKVSGITQARELAAGGDETCAIQSTTMYCWGAGTRGQLGNAARTDSSTPVAVRDLPADQLLAAVRVGSNFACAIMDPAQYFPDRASVNLYCWGAGNTGQLGNGTSLDASTPQFLGTRDVSLNADWSTQLSSGGASSCFVEDSDAVLCWGAGSLGQLGDGATSASTTPVAASIGDQDPYAVTVGAQHACAIFFGGGSVRCWGEGTRGQIGDGGSTTRLLPTEVPGQLARRIAAGTSFTCALHADGTVDCWGAGDRGQLGNGGTADSPSPVAVQGLS